MAGSSEEADRIEANRRQLASRDTRWARIATDKLVASGATPNGISIVGLLCGVLAGASLFTLAWPHSLGLRIVLLLAAIAGIQSRLLCNLLDGMVAMAAKTNTRFGEIYNDLPDRLADWAILLGAGYAALSPQLGWAASVLAVMTAYFRVLGKSCGTPMRYLGPMAKQHRMATLTAACALAILACFWERDAIVLRIALWIIVAGCIVTLARRLLRIRSDLIEVRP